MFPSPPALSPASTSPTEALSPDLLSHRSVPHPSLTIYAQKLEHAKQFAEAFEQEYPIKLLSHGRLTILQNAQMLGLSKLEQHLTGAASNIGHGYSKWYGAIHKRHEKDPADKSKSQPRLLGPTMDDYGRPHFGRALEEIDGALALIKEAGRQHPEPSIHGKLTSLESELRRVWRPWVCFLGSDSSQRPDQHSLVWANLYHEFRTYRLDLQQREYPYPQQHQQFCLEPGPHRIVPLPQPVSDGERSPYEMMQYRASFKRLYMSEADQLFDDIHASRDQLIYLRACLNRFVLSAADLQTFNSLATHTALISLLKTPHHSAMSTVYTDARHDFGGSDDGPWRLKVVDDYLKHLISFLNDKALHDIIGRGDFHDAGVKADILQMYTALKDTMPFVRRAIEVKIQAFSNSASVFRTPSWPRVLAPPPSSLKTPSWPLGSSPSRPKAKGPSPSPSQQNLRKFMDGGAKR